ncbi:MAG: DNA recombination protein RmuC [Bacteroidota bacterium]|nr:DNA recombination protein RmuC [Bacteroidota bacterium]
MVLLSLLLGILVGGAIGYLLQSSRLAGLRAEVNRLPVLTDQIQTLQSENSDLLVQLTKARSGLENELKRSQEYLAFIENAEKRFADTFGKLSKEALSENAKDFRDLATSDFSSRQEHLNELLKPVKENLTKLEEFNRALEEKRASAYSSLEAHITSLVESEQFLRTETSQLVKALRQPAARGTWGEQQLRRILEIAGLQEHLHFNEQVSMTIGEKNLRADLVLTMADGKHIIVDSKAPIEIYMDVVNAATKEEQAERLRSLTQNIKAYAKDLQSKEYWKFYDDSPGVVVMFIPGESILNAAMQFDPTLWDECVHRRVLLASPTTLIAILYSIAFGWRQDSFEKNAEEIRKAGEDIYSRLSVFAEHLQDLGKHLSRSVSKYNDAIGSLDRSVLTSARRMNELGISAGKKVLPELVPIDPETRSSQAPELLS